MEYLEISKKLYQTAKYMKIKYLKTENASISIDYNKELLEKVLNEIKELEKINIERINIECNASKLKELDKLLSSNISTKIPIFIKINKYDNEYKKELINLNKYFYIVIKTNIKDFPNIEKNDEYFYEILTNYKEKENLLDLILHNENIIINMETKSIKDYKSINESLTYLVNNSNNKLLYFENLFISKDLIYKCPYNIYLNNSNSNRKYGNNIPRNIYIDNNFNVYAISIKNKKLIIGNLKENTIINILSNSKKTTGYKNFKKYNKILFFEVLDQCPFNTIDYISYLNEVINNE